MSGHSKWSNIKNKKEKTDKAKAKVYTKASKDIMIAIKEGGNADPNANSKLASAIAKAKAMNVPNDNIERVLKKASSAGGANFETLTYEGYGAGGVAVIVEAMTDNKNRTASEVRHAFDKHGGKLGASGSVSFMFKYRGVLVIDEYSSEDKVMEDALEAGASDISFDEDLAIIDTEPNDFDAVFMALKDKGYEFLESAVEMVPDTYAENLSDEDSEKVGKMIDMLEELDDVSDVWSNLK